MGWVWPCRWHYCKYILLNLLFLFFFLFLLPPNYMPVSPQIRLLGESCSSLSTSRIEFETPPPPKGLPELPGPPSSSKDEMKSTNIMTSNRQNDVPLTSTLQRHLVCPACFILVHTNQVVMAHMIQFASSDPFTEIPPSTVPHSSALSHTACHIYKNICAVWGLVFYTWLSLSKEPDEGSRQ